MSTTTLDDALALVTGVRVERHAASAFFDRPRLPGIVERDRQLLNAAASLTVFTAVEVAKKACGCNPSPRYGCRWHAPAGRMLRAFRDEGHLVVLNPGGRPLRYRWAEQ